MTAIGKQFEHLFHGTSAVLKPGDTVEARGSYIDGQYSTAPEDRRAFATPSRSEARDHGPHVYQVEYQADEAPEEVKEAPSPRFISRKGYTVVKKVD